ncbi:hypothetical protein TRIUR3_33451 [Triticum urartu]|uniref:Ribosomal RNA-processing protein 17 n=1 Tax=Triticum urartu TaxID=4572 RepID=M8A3W0_TRIUA|nr:hypothetical protein TRIUR3_33451 [Triticum urartu]
MEASEVEGEDVVVGQMPTFMVPKHINKRALKNKALSISLDNKALKDFVTGFHKRKKKRRKEAQRITQEKDRRKRIEARKKRREWAVEWRLGRGGWWTCGGGCNGEI